MTYTTTATIKEKMAQAGYSTNQLINTALSAALNTGTPLLIEGAPGSGKTSMAKAVAEAFGLPFIRVQFYDGLTADKILYDYNYQRQLLTIESIKPTLESELQDRIQFAERPREFYLGLDYLAVDGQQIPFRYADAYVIVVPSTNQVTVFRGALMEMVYIPRVVMVDVPREESAGAAMAYMMASLKYPDAENPLDAMLEDMSDGGDA